MRVTAKVDYAVRAAAELAAAANEGPIKGEKLADSQDIPLQFLEHILLELKHVGIVRARRGAKGGYWLARPTTSPSLTSSARSRARSPTCSRRPRSRSSIAATPST